MTESALFCSENYENKTKLPSRSIPFPFRSAEWDRLTQLTLKALNFSGITQKHRAKRVARFFYHYLGLNKAQWFGSFVIERAASPTDRLPRARGATTELRGTSTCAGPRWGAHTRVYAPSHDSWGSRSPQSQRYARLWRLATKSTFRYITNTEYSAAFQNMMTIIVCLKHSSFKTRISEIVSLHRHYQLLIDGGLWPI